MLPGICVRRHRCKLSPPCEVLVVLPPPVALLSVTAPVAGGLVWPTLDPPAPTWRQRSAAAAVQRSPVGRRMVAVIAAIAAALPAPLLPGAAATELDPVVGFRQAEPLARPDGVDCAGVPAADDLYQRLKRLPELWVPPASGRCPMIDVNIRAPRAVLFASTVWSKTDWWDAMWPRLHPTSPASYQRMPGRRSLSRVSTGRLTSRWPPTVPACCASF
mmetsp:Transcript_135183/g.432090  ORF Transcript_135183/g.432090 Transcript_135183/m.432090 type:complete len:217 (+) Transcript_135183:63-713(+)